MSFTDFIFHVSALGKTVEVVCSKANESKCCKDDKDIERGEKFVFALLFDMSEVDLAK